LDAVGEAYPRRKANEGLSEALNREEQIRKDMTMGIGNQKQCKEIKSNTSTFSPAKWQTVR
jgi:hypothetical protein